MLNYGIRKENEERVVTSARLTTGPILLKKGSPHKNVNRVFMRTVISVVVMVLTSTLTSLLFGEESGLVARWDFDDGSGVHIKDSSGLGNQGTIHGAKRVAVGNGYALRFDGVDDYVDCGNGESLNLLGPLTLEAWVKPEAPPRGEPGILGKFLRKIGNLVPRDS